MEQLYFEEVFKEPIKDFTSHLNLAGNNRILFSGKYGSGKTSFLKDFFDPGNQIDHLGSEKYEVFHLFPVNYSISSNDDIVRYLKYDLIIELLQKATDISQVDLRIIDTLPPFIKANLAAVTASLIRMVPKIGKDIVDSWEKLNALKDKFLAFHKKANEQDGGKLLAHLKLIESESGSLFENDVITKIIAENVNKEDKESVLIIDDLDRVDPEHIFRLLNVFAAHFDNGASQGAKNKFGFSKVILVCDAKNVKNIFFHKYGMDVDFGGYADKFFSSHIYPFDNKKAVTSIIRSIFESLNFVEKNNNIDSEIKILQSFYFKNRWVTNMLSLLLEHDHISLRNLLKIHGQEINYHYENVIFDKKESYREIRPWRIPIIMQIKLVQYFFGDKESFLAAIKKCQQQGVYIDDYEVHASSLIFVLAEKQHSFRNDFPFQHDGQSLVVAPHVNFGNDQVEFVQLYIDKGKDSDDQYIKQTIYHPTIDQYWDNLHRVTQNLITAGYIK